MYAAYTGPLYEVLRTSDNATRNISVKAGAYFADSAIQTSFCGFEECTVVRIFDQSPRNNHLLMVVVPAPNVHGWPNKGINAMRDPLMVGGHPVYSAYFEGGTEGTGINHTGSGTMGFRCNTK